MTFQTLYQELSDRLGAYDHAVAGDLIKLKRWINMAQQYICGKRLWPFMLAQEIVQTTVDVTTSTATIAVGNTAMGFTIAPTVSYTGRYIKFAGSPDWYKITAHTANEQAATISPAFGGPDDVAAGEYTVRKLLYSTSTPLMQILDMKQLTTPTRLVSQGPAATDAFLSLYSETGTPTHYIPSSPTSTGAIQFSLYPSPDEVMNIMVRGKRVLSDLSATSDEPLIPAPWQDAIINIAAFYGFQSLDDTRANTEFTVGESRIDDMATVYSHDLGRHRIVGAPAADTGLTWTIPADLGPIL